MGGGDYHFRSSSMDIRVLQQMASRNDGQLPIDWQGKDVQDVAATGQQAAANDAPTDATDAADSQTNE